MSETQTQTVVAKPPAEIKYVLYDPDPARRKRRRRARRYDPEPARSRRRYSMNGGGGQVALVDSALDGVAWGYLAKRIPIPNQQIGPVQASDAVAIGGAVIYEKFYMKRKWTHALVAGAIAYMVGRWTA